MKSRRTILWGAIAVVLCATAGVVAAVRHSTSAVSSSEIPTTRVMRGDLEMKVFLTGELRASHSETLTAPPIGGGVLQITRLIHTGTPVKKGDVVIEFDPSEQRFKVDQSRSELLQAEQEITKAKADAAVVAAQDKVALLKARFDVRRAELDVQKNELASAIDAKKNELILEGAKRVLAELEQDVKSRSASNQASISLAVEKQNKAKLAMEQAQDSIHKMQVTAPMDGLVALEKNEASSGGFSRGMSLPEYREGDQVEPGTNIGRVIDPQSMEVTAKVGELDRNNVKEGQAVDLKLDALPDITMHGTVKTVGGSNTHHFFDDDNSTTFEVIIALNTADLRMRPGLTAGVFIVGDPQHNVSWVPRLALFLKESKRIVYVRNGSHFDEREVTIKAQNESRAVIDGIGAGTEIALIDPTAPMKTSNAGSSAPSLGGGTP